MIIFSILIVVMFLNIIETLVNRLSSNPKPNQSKFAKDNSSPEITYQAVKDRKKSNSKKRDLYIKICLILYRKSIGSKHSQVTENIVTDKLTPVSKPVKSIRMSSNSETRMKAETSSPSTKHGTSKKDYMMAKEAIKDYNLSNKDNSSKEIESFPTLTEEPK